jgi:hypothetical protein
LVEQEWGLVGFKNKEGKVKERGHLNVMQRKDAIAEKVMGRLLGHV